MSETERPVSPFERILRALIDAELVALTDPELLPDLVEALERAADRNEHVLKDLGAWLIDQDEVDDVFATDFEIQRFLQNKLSGA